jgi:potassium efflux system protein
MLKLIAAALTFIFILTAAVISLSQEQSQLTSGKKDSNIFIEATGSIEIDDLKRYRTAAENAGDLTEEVKKAVRSFLDRAIIFREEEAQLRQEIEDVKRQVQAAPKRIEAIESELEEPLSVPEDVSENASDMKSAEIEAQLQKVKTNLLEKTADLKKLTDQLNDLKNQPLELQQEVVRLKQRLKEIGVELAAGPPPNEPRPVGKARKIALATEQARIETEINAIENRLGNHETLTALLTAERELGARQVAQQEAQAKAWQAEVQRIREREAEQQRVMAEEAREQAVNLPPVLQKQFDINIELGKLLEKATAEEALVTERLKHKQARLKQIEEEFALAREQLQYPLYTETIGLALREQRRDLPDIKTFLRDSERRQVQMGEIRSIQLDLDRRQRGLADFDRAVASILEKQEIPENKEGEPLETALHRLLSDRRELLRKLQIGYQRLFKKLQSLEFVEQQIAVKAEEEAEYLDEHLLWIRSTKGIGASDVKNLPAAVHWISNPAGWLQTVQNLGQSFLGKPIMWTLGLLIIFAFIGLRRRAHRKLSQIAHSVYSVKTDSFFLTLQALALTNRPAFGWPLLLIFCGWQLLKMPSSSDFIPAVSHGLIFAGQLLIGGLFLYEMCWKDGVARVHFKWPESVQRILRRSLKWGLLLVVMMHFIIAAVQTKNEPDHVDSLGRLAFMALMIGLSVWAAYVLRFSGEILAMLLRRPRHGWLVRLRIIWYPLAVGIPLVLAILAGMGYYSAFYIYLRLGETIALILSLIIIKDLVLRWFSITQRRLSFEEIQRKKEAQAEKLEKEESTGGVEAEGLSIEEPEINLELIYEKNRALLRTLIFFSALIGLWLIWAEVLPALNFLENIELWSYSSEVDGVTKMIPITLANLMVAVIVVVVTVVAAKNLPALLETILLNWFTLDAGSRHAFSMVFNYAITIIGIVVAFTSIGFRWSNIQWLIAALGVGLGFGLQEVVANFVCGLVVLFERPFRIGDTVTIGDVSGAVSRIRIRATTIIDWDRKELIVPNKEFITGRLINWSLSDNIIRIKIPLGIAYGSDTNLAEELMLKAAKANPLVLPSPEPQAVFLGFGDSSLNFELRVFINGIEDWIPMLHKLNRTVDDEFRKAKVTISFPQRDVHLDQIGPLEVRVVSERPASSAAEVAAMARE